MGEGLVWDDEASPGAAPEPAPAAEQPGLVWDDEAAPGPEELDAQRDARLKSMFESSLRQAPDRQASVLELHKRTGVPQDLVEKRFDDIKRSYDAATFEPKKWREANPELAQLVESSPEVGGLVMREEEHSVLSDMLRKLYRLYSWREEAHDALESQFAEAVLGQPLTGYPTEVPDSKKIDLPPPKLVGMVTDSSATQGTLAKVSAAFGRSRRQTEYADVGALMLARELAGKDVSDLEARATQLEADIAPRFYDAGPWEQVLIEGANILPSVGRTMAGAGVVGAAGAALGAGAGALTRNPGAVAAGAGFGLSLGAKVGSGVASFEQEAGGAYLDMLKEKTDDGRPMDRATARGAALVYGAVAGAIESVTFGTELSAWGPLGDAIRNGSGQAFLKGVLKDAGAKAILKDVGTRWVKGALSEAGEEASQQAAQELIAYLARSKTAGSLQKPDVEGSLDAIAQAGTSAFKGSLAIAPGMAVSNAGQQLAGARLERQLAVRGAGKASAILDAAMGSRAARAAPEAVAKMVADASAESGEPVTHIYVDPAEATKLFQENQPDNPNAIREAAVALMGPDGPAKLQEARVTGARLEVPVADFLEKWGTSQGAERLAEHLAVRPGAMTGAELKAEGQDIQKAAEQIAAEAEAKEAKKEPLTLAEQRAKDMVEQLVATGMSKKEARIQVAIPEAFTRTLMARAPQAAQAVLGEQALALNVAEGDGQAVAGALEQPAFHGTPHRGIERFGLHAIGTGEGAQAYGWGMYFAGNRAVAEYYRKTLSRPGRGLQVDDVSLNKSELGVWKGGIAKVISGRMSDYGLSSEKALEYAEKVAERDLEEGRKSIAEINRLAVSEAGRAKALNQANEDIAGLQAALDWVRELKKNPKRVSLVGQGQLYRTEVPEDSELLDWDKPLGEMSEKVQRAVRGVWDLHFGSPLGPGERGDVVYRQLAQELGSPELASDELHQAGIPGLRYLDQGSRADGGGTHNYVVWDEGRMPIQETFYQDSAAGAARGYTQLQREGVKRLVTIALNPNADRSTFLHESAHVFLELFGDIAERPEAPQSVKDDWATLLKEFGITSRSELKREHHEQWARSFEAYAWEGKAPSARLAGAFERFKLWLKDIYRTLRSLNVELSDDLRGVFDRMLATDEEIARTKESMGMRTMSPAEAERVGMTGEAYQDYLRDQEQATSRVAQQVELRALKDRLREQESWWKEEEAKEVEKAEAEYDALPARQAKQFLRGKHPDSALPISLDRKVVEQMVGKENAKRFATKKDGVHPDEVADLGNGDFPTGKAMLEAILALPEKETWAKEKAAERMRERHPELLDEKEKLRALVAKGLNGEQGHQWLLREIAALRKKASSAGRPIEAIRRAAELIAERREVGSLRPKSALREERSAAEKALQAAAKDNFPQALVFKEQQLLNMLLHRKLSELQDEADGALNVLRRYTETNTRAALGKAGESYLAQVDSMLDSIELREGVPRVEMDRRAGTLAWLQKEQEEGRNPYLPESVLRNLEKTKHWKTLTVGELTDLRDAVENVAHLAKLKTTLLENGKRRDFHEAKGEILEALDKLPTIERSLIAKNATAKEKRHRFARKAEAGAIRPEELVRRIDSGASNGPMRRLFWNPISDGDYHHRILVQEVVSPVLDVLAKLSPEAKRSLREESFEVKGHRMTMEQAVAMALNCGNESNYQKMLRGLGMLHEQGFQNLNEQDVEGILSRLGREHWELVQKIGERLEAKWPEVAEMHRRMTGLPPKKVSPRPFTRTLADGSEVKLTGWYYPVIYDATFPGAGKRGAEAESLRSFQLFDRGYHDVITPQGHLESRSGDYARPLDLTLDRLPGKVNEAMKDLAMREALISSHALLTDPDVQSALSMKVGLEGVSVLEGMLRDTANDLVIPDGGASWLMGGMNRLRSATTGAVFAYNIGQMLQNLSGFVAVLDQVPARFLKRGLWRWAWGRGDTFNFAASKSKEMLTRSDHFEHSIGEDLGKALDRRVVGKHLDKVTEIGLAMFSSTDKVVATATWVSAYEHALAPVEKKGLGLTEEEAVRHADQVVRTSLASGRTMDLPAFMRDKRFKLITMFAGWANGELNRYMASLHDARAEVRAKYRARALKRLVGTWAILGVTRALSDLLVGKGPDDDDKDGLDLGDVGKWLAIRTLMGPLPDIPYAGGLIRNVAAGRDASFTPWIRGPEEAVKAAVHGWNGMGKYLEEDDPALLGRAALEGLSAAAYFRGLPVAQVRGTAGYLLNEGSEDVEKGKVLSVGAGVMWGRPRKGTVGEYLQELEQ